MAFNQVVDGDYTNPVLMGRRPVDAGLPHQTHFIWRETLIQHHDNYHPRIIGTEHPDSYTDPISPNSQTGSNIYDLGRPGAGRNLYLIDEKILQRRGPLVVFTRDYSSLPDDWDEKEFGYHSFPGKKVRRQDADGTIVLVTASQPKTLPCLIESKYKYRLGPPLSLLSFDVPTYYSTGASFDGSNVVEYTGYAYDEDGGITAVFKRGGGSETRPVISTEVTRWKGEIFQIKTRKVVSTLR